MMPESMRHDSDRLVVCWPGGHESIYDSIWLLDNSPEHRDKNAGQRLIDAADLPEDPQICTAAFGEEWIEVAWAGIGKRARFPAQWLREQCHCNGHISSSVPRRRELTLWGSQDSVRFCAMNYRRFCESTSARLEWLRAAASWGIAFLHGIACEEGEVLRAASSVGWVRETNYGRVFDVAVSSHPTNLAYTNTALGVHTDNPYRDPVPGLQILHCLKAAAGGESLFVDGFAVAETLRQTDREAFDLIVRTKVEFRFADASTELSSVRPLIHLHDDGTIAAVHYNSRSIAPLNLAAESSRLFYRAYQRFARLLRDPRFEVRIRLEPGDLVLFNNHRVLHGRTAFNSSEPRLLRDAIWNAMVSPVIWPSWSGLRRRDMDFIDRIFDLFEKRGAAEYFGEALSQREHALETAFFATHDGAGDALVAAALLHDIGHLLTGKEGMAEKGIDERHQDSGSAWLAKYFSPAITEAIRLHVDAKRYLCKTDQAYLTKLSPASILSLELQGRPFSESDARKFEGQARALSAIRLRSWDDMAKVPLLRVPGLEHYRELLYRESTRRAGV